MAPILHLGPYAFYSFGFLVGVGICVSCFALDLYFRLHQLSINLALFAAIVIPIGFVCARLDDVLLAHPAQHPLSADLVSRLAHGGLTYFGGVLGATAVWVLLVLLYRLPLLRTLDALFCIAPGYAIGRIGCFLAGDGDYGRPSYLPWAVAFPHGIVPTSVRVHPTMLYLCFWELLVFCILWRLSRPGDASLRPGTLLGLYLLATGAGRFLVEFLSRNPVLHWGLKEAQMVAVGLMLMGSVILLRALDVTKRLRRVPSRTGRRPFSAVRRRVA